MKVSRKMLANYLGIHVNNCKRYYDDYLRLCKSKRDYLTIADVASVDGISILECSQLMGYPLYFANLGKR